MLPRPEIDFRRTPVTLILMAIIVALELVCTLDGDRRNFYYNDCKLGILSLIWRGELWRPFTTTLLHGSLIHGAFNALWLSIFGPALEHRLGSYRFLGLVVLLAFVSMMPQFLVTNYDVAPHQQIQIVGFSGVVYGMFGLLWVGRRFRPELDAVCNTSTVQLMVGWFFLCIVLTRLQIWSVANIAHGAGCLFGVLYGLVLFDRQNRWRWGMLAAVATWLVLATLFYCPGHPLYEQIQQPLLYLERLPLE